MCQEYPSWSVNRGVTPAPATRALTAAAAATSSSQSNTAPSAGLKAWTVRRSASLSSPTSLTWCAATNAAKRCQIREPLLGARRGRRVHQVDDEVERVLRVVAEQQRGSLDESEISRCEGL